MKFKFCGDLDAPDWLLKEITVLAKISAIRIRLLCTQVINHLLGVGIDYEKIDKLTKDSNLERTDVKAAIAALNFILTNSSKYNVEDVTLSNELQQLGLPKEHCDALSKPYKDNVPKLREKFTQQSLQLPRLESIEWRVDYLLSSSLVNELNSPTIQLKLNVNSQIDNKEKAEVAFELTPEKLRVLLNELKAAQEYMDGVL